MACYYEITIFGKRCITMYLELITLFDLETCHSVMEVTVGPVLSDLQVFHRSHTATQFVPSTLAHFLDAHQHEIFLHQDRLISIPSNASRMG